MVPEHVERLERLIVDGFSVEEAVLLVEPHCAAVSPDELEKTAREIERRLKVFTRATSDDQRDVISAKLLTICGKAREVGDLKSELKGLEQLADLNGLVLPPGTKKTPAKLAPAEVEKRIAEIVELNPKLRAKVDGTG